MLTPGQLIATGHSTPLTRAQARRLVWQEYPRLRRDLRCATEANYPSIVRCTFLAYGPTGLNSGEAGAIEVRTNRDGTVTEVNSEPPFATLSEFVAAADRACLRRAQAIVALPRLPSLQQTARLLPIEQRFEAALVPVANIPPRSGGLGASRFFSQFLDYEFSLYTLHQAVLKQQPLNLTQTDRGLASGYAAAATNDATAIGINCDLRTYLEPPPAPTHSTWPALPPARRVPPHTNESPAANPGFTVQQATSILAANLANSNIHCDPGTNGWTYICTYINGGQLHRDGLLAKALPDYKPLDITLPATGPIPTPNS